MWRFCEAMDGPAYYLVLYLHESKRVNRPAGDDRKGWENTMKDFSDFMPETIVATMDPNILANEQGVKNLTHDQLIALDASVENDRGYTM